MGMIASPHQPDASSKLDSSPTGTECTARQLEFAEAAALRPEDLAPVQQQVRARVLRWFSRAGQLHL